MLLRPQEVAGAADLHVAHGDVEARPEVGELLDGAQAQARLAGQALAPGHQQVGVGALLRAADAAADLVELRQAEHVGAVHQDRVHRRDVDAGLDDHGTDEAVELPFQEVEHDPLELARRHLAVGHGEADLGQQLLQVLAEPVDRLHAVVDEVDLAVSPPKMDSKH